MTRKVEKIEISKIEVLENSRASMNKDELSSLMGSIEGQGLISPIEVTGNNQSGYVLVCGRRRLEAYKKLDYEFIEAFVKEDVSAIDYLVRNLTENIQRKDISVMEKGRVFYKLHETHNMSFSEIAAKMHISVNLVKNAIEMHNLSIPEEYRSKITTMVQAGKNTKKGMIAVATALRIGHMKKEFGLSPRIIKDIYKHVQKEETSIAKLRVIAGLLRGGMDIKKAIEESEKYVCIRLDMPMNKEELEKEMKRLGATSKQNFCAKVFYDGYKGNHNLVTADTFGNKVVIKK